MIYTITFNPALDYIIKVAKYKEGEVNRTSDERILAGGKGINVSTVLSNLGFPTTALGFTAGFTGIVLEDMLEKSGVHCDFIRLDEGISRINVKIKADKETEINGRGPKISDKAIDALYRKLDCMKEDDILVLAGSVPYAMGDFVYSEIAEYLCKKKLKIVVDAEGRLLTETLKFHPFLIKPNHIELGDIFKRQLNTDDEIAQCANKLREMGARNVLVSMSRAGAMLVTENGDVIRRRSLEGKVLNSIGAGDSMVAGFIAGYLEKNSYEYALKMGLCAGGASAFSENLASGDEIRRLMENFE